MEDPNAASGSTSTMAPPGFQKASEMYKASNPPVVGSLRDASGGLPSIPKSVNSASSNLIVSSTSTEGDKGNDAPGDAATQTGGPVKPVKPINRPATSKNAIVYNAVQVRFALV